MSNTRRTPAKKAAAKRAPRKTTARKRTTTAKPPERRNIESAYREDGVFDLGLLEREDAQEPFRAEHPGKPGKIFEFKDFYSVDYRALVRAGDPVSTLESLLGDQYADFVAAGPLEIWQIEALMQGWEDHYGVDMGNSAASSMF